MTTASQFDYEYDAASNLTKEHYDKVGAGIGDRFAYDAYHRLSAAWMGVTSMSGGNPNGYVSGQMHEYLTYGLDHANNRSTSSSQTAPAVPPPTTYSLQNGTHPQGQSNRYDVVTVPGAPTAVVHEYDDRGNMTYDGRFVYRYDFMNRLQMVWRVLPSGGAPVEEEKYAVVDEEGLADAESAVKLAVPDLYSRRGGSATTTTMALPAGSS